MHSITLKSALVTDVKKLSPVGSGQRNISKTSIQNLAIKKYQASGYGINYKDVMETFLVGKGQAQRSLKHFHCHKVLFTANDLIDQGIYFLQNKNPQRYYPNCNKAQIIENLKKKSNYTITSGETLSSTIHLPRIHTLGNTLQRKKAQIFLDVLLILPYFPVYIHKLQMIVTIDKTDYKELIQLQHNDRRKGSHEEIVGRRHVIYLLSANGTIEIFVRSNDSPFKIETDDDQNILFSFLGQVRDRLLYHMGDVRESYIPSLMDWILVQCDLNKDIEIDDKAQITLPYIQLRHAGRVFREYVKIINGKALCRVEESLRLNELLPEALDNIRHPFKSLERKLDDLPKCIDELFNQRILQLTGTDRAIRSEQHIQSEKVSDTTVAITDTKRAKNKEGEVI
jgi:hypothetical protein